MGPGTRTIVGLAALTLLGAALRMEGIAVKSMSHPEMWAPLIPLPEELADPPERPSLRDLLNYNLGVDTHPPGYYLFLWAWMKCFGASLWAIRMPSVLFGAASIPLVWWLGQLTGLPAAGWVTAALLALNGYHIAWSSFGRMYSMACFLGLLSSVLLLKLTRHRGGVGLCVAYSLVTLAGLSVNVYVWALLATQILWVLWETWNRRLGLPAVWQAQVLTLILGAPLLTFAAYQSHHNVAPLSARPGRFAMELAAFAFLIPVDGVTDLLPHGAPLPPWTSLPHLVALSLAAILLILARREMSEQAFRPAESEPWRAAWLWTSAASIGMSTGFLWVVREHAAETREARLLAAFPLVLCGCGWVMPGLWKQLPIPARARKVHPLAVLSAGPVLVLAVFALAHPIFIARGLAIFAPYVMLLLAAGLISLWRLRRSAGAAAGAVILSLHVESFAAHRPLTIDPIDFAAFADTLRPKLRDDDLVFIKKSWHGTPVLFYFRPPGVRVLARGYADAARRNPRSRIWCVTTYQDPLPEEAFEAVRSGRRVDVVQVEQARAELFAPQSEVPEH